MTYFENILITTLCFILFNSCSNKDPNDKNIAGIHPIKQIRYSNIVINIVADDNTHVSDFVDLSVFRGLKPEMGLNKAEQILSKATRVIGDPNSYIAEFWLDSLRIEIRDDRENDMAPVLIAIPQNMGVDKFVISPIAQLLNDAWFEAHPGKDPIIIISDQSDAMSVWIETKSKKVDNIEWHKVF